MAGFLYDFEKYDFGYPISYAPLRRFRWFCKSMIFRNKLCIFLASLFIRKSYTKAVFLQHSGFPGLQNLISLFCRPLKNIRISLPNPIKMKLFRPRASRTRFRGPGVGFLILGDLSKGYGFPDRSLSKRSFSGPSKFPESPGSFSTGRFRSPQLLSAALSNVG